MGLFSGSNNGGTLKDWRRECERLEQCVDKLRTELAGVKRDTMAWKERSESLADRNDELEQNINRPKNELATLKSQVVIVTHKVGTREINVEVK